MTQVISPTPGRIVWFYPAPHEGIATLNGQPLAAIVAGVHSDTLVNLSVLDAYGNHQQRSNVTLVQPGNDAPAYSHAAWMPYQVSAAGITVEPVVVATPESEAVAEVAQEPVDQAPAEVAADAPSTATQE